MIAPRIAAVLAVLFQVTHATLSQFRINEKLCNSNFDENGNFVRLRTFKIPGLTLEECVSYCENAATCHGFERYQDYGGTGNAVVLADDCIVVDFPIQFSYDKCDGEQNNLRLYQRPRCDWVPVETDKRCGEATVETYIVDVPFIPAPVDWQGCTGTNQVKPNIETRNMCEENCNDLAGCIGYQHFDVAVGANAAEDCILFTGTMQNGNQPQHPICYQINPSDLETMNARCEVYASQVDSCGLKYSFDPTDRNSCKCVTNGFSGGPPYASEQCNLEPAQGHTVYEYVCDGGVPSASPTMAPTRSPTLSPTQSPTISPTPKATIPTTSPTTSPTSPSASPTVSPTASPTLSPTGTNTTTIDPGPEPDGDSLWWIGVVAGGAVVLGGTIFFGVKKMKEKDNRNHPSNNAIEDQLMMPKTESMFSAPTQAVPVDGIGPMAGGFGASAFAFNQHTGSQTSSSYSSGNKNQRSTFGLLAGRQSPKTSMGSQPDDLDDISWLEAKKLAKQLGIQNTYGSREELLVRIGTALSKEKASSSVPGQRIPSKGTIADYLSQLDDDETSSESKWKPSSVSADSLSVVDMDV